MGGETFVISSVTAGLQTQWGSATVENVAQGATFQGFLSSRLSQALVRDTQSTYLSFAFTDLSVYSGRLDFTPTQRPFLPQSFDSLLFGQTVVENTAQAIYLESIPPVAIGLPFVADRPPWLFDFVALPANDLALHFAFGGARLVVPQGVASFEAGAFTIEAPWTITFEGFELSRFGQALVSFELPLTFDFVGLAENDLAIQFNFGGAALVLPGGIDSFRPGAAVVENTADAIYPVGIPPVRFGLPLVSAFEPLLFDFVEVTQPNAANIPFNFGTSRAARFDGWVSTAFGAMLVLGELDQYASFTGFSSTQFGHPSLSFDGIDVVYFQGFNSFAAGEFEIGVIPSQDVVFGGVEEATEWGEETFVSHFNRVLPPIPGFYGTQFGVSWLAHSPRTVEFRPPAEIPLYFGHFQVGYHRDVEMVSTFEMTQWGIPHVDLRRFILEGLDSLQFPEFFRVTRSPRPVQPFSWDARALGEPFVWNLTQFVEFVAPDTNPDTYKGVRFGRLHWFKVLNIARAVQLNGLNSMRFASSPFDAVLAGRAVVLRGFDSLTYPPFNEWQRHLVAYAVRSVPMWGLDSFRAVTYHRIHNDAWLAAFSGAESGAFGRAFVWRWMQRIHAQGRRHDESGLPWVEFGVRSFQMRTPRQMLQMPHIIVGHTPLHIEMEGLHSFGFTNLFSFARPIPRIYPRWDIQYWDARNFTPPRVWNVTPELRMFGRNMLRVGDKPFVWFRVRDVAVNGWNSFLTDGFVIARRDRELPIPGFQSSVINQDFYVARFGPGLPFDQIVRMVGDKSGQYNGVHSRFGEPQVTGNNLHFESELVFSRFGVWAIFGHSIVFTQHGSPAHGFFESDSFQVSGGVRTITIGAYRNNQDLEPPKFRVTPHTIWMRTDTPQQARQNHPPPSFCRVDAFCNNSTPPGYSGPSTWPWWGSARVRLKDGVDEPVQMWSANSAGVPYIAITLGQPRVENEIRTIYPESWESFWQGYPTVTTPTDQFMRVWSGDQESTLEFGEVHVDPYPPRPRWVLPPSVAPVSFGQHEVQNQHRFVYLSGLDATQWGSNNPMVYHYPRGFTPIDSDMTQWGTQWLSHSPRWYTMGGVDFFTSRWTSFPLRMRVELDKRYIYGYKGFESMRIPHFQVSGTFDHVIEMYGFVWPNACSEFEINHV